MYVDELKIKPHIVQRLKKAGIYEVAQILGKNRFDLLSMKIPGIGKKASMAIEDALELLTSDSAN